MRNLWYSEWKMMSRQRSYYSFLLLWVSVFSLLFLLAETTNGISGFTNITGTIVNIILYLLPLFMMIIGSFSIANEMENGQWHLLCTFPIRITTYFFGKLGGLLIAQIVVYTLSFSISMMIGLIAGIQLSVPLLLGIYFFSLILIFLFLILGIFLGTLVKTRWKALTLSVVVWFFLIMIWPTALIALLGLLPYPLIEMAMKTAMLVNPAEFLRVFLIIQWDSGAIFGQSYDSLIPFFQSTIGWMFFIAYLAAYLLIFLALSIHFLGRSRMQ
jgi:Cu-processing system permease protein